MANYTKDSDIIIIEDKLIFNPLHGLKIRVRPALVIFATDNYITELLSQRLISKSTSSLK